MVGGLGVRISESGERGLEVGVLGCGMFLFLTKDFK